MIVKQWLHTFNAQKIELKIASILALVTACLVISIVLWSFFVGETSTKPSVTASNIVVQTTPTPEQLQKRKSPSSKDNDLRSNAAAQLKKVTTPAIKPHQPNTKTKHIKLVLGQGSFYVQVGAFNQPKLARLMLGKMKQKYKYAKIKPKTNSHAVWVGPVMSKQDAQTLKKHLLRKNNIQGFITTEK